MIDTIDSPIGFRKFHTDPSLNFQLNRWLSNWDEAEVCEVASRIGSFAEWKQVMLAQAGKAEEEGRILPAAYFYRAAEFFMPPGDPDKLRAYEKFMELFYAQADGRGYAAVEVPYGAQALPALVFSPQGEKCDTLIIHCGFDSFKEEFIDMGLAFARRGFEVVLFEGPGQGAALLRQGLFMPHDWERPVGAVIDHFDLTGCSLLGVSLGGYLAPRAAAFDKRIERVIAFDVLEDLFDCFADKLPVPAVRIISLLLRLRQRHLLNRLVRHRMADDELTHWGVSHGMHVSGTRDPYDFFRWTKQMTTRSIAPRITQDFLLMGGADDHLVPLRQFFRQARNLPNVRSLTTRLFMAGEQAQAHCQVGNMGLAIDFMVDWLLFQQDHSAPETADLGTV